MHPCRFPANVLAGFEQDCGATYFNLTDLHVRSTPWHWPRAPLWLPALDAAAQQPLGGTAVLAFCLMLTFTGGKY